MLPVLPVVSVVSVSVSCPVLSLVVVLLSALVVLALMVLSRGDPFMESRTGQNGAEPARKTPIYIGISPGLPRSAQECPGNRLKPLFAKNQSFVTDNMPYKAFRGRITPNFDISLWFCLFFRKNGVPLQTEGREIALGHQES